jgi:ribosomal protein L37AE/L43A
MSPSSHVIERAATGRAKCRGCEQKIARGEWRFGERLPNPFADGDAEMTHWFHLACAAFTRPESFLETLATAPDDIGERRELEREARLGASHRRLPRVRRAERAPSARAACRSCHQPIPKNAWRIALSYYEDGRFTPSGFIHLPCAAEYLGTIDIVGRLRHFSAVNEAAIEEIRVELARARTSGQSASTRAADDP